MRKMEDKIVEDLDPWESDNTGLSLRIVGVNWHMRRPNPMAFAILFFP